MWKYSDKVKDHFLHPRNVGEIENPDGKGQVGSLACGDALTLTFKLDENKRIKDVRFLTFGCASAIASASALTEMLKGLTIEEADKITNEQIAEYLGGLPREKMHCSVLGRDALEKAIADYRGEQEKKEGNLVCECFQVTDLEIQRAVRENHLKTIEGVIHYTKAGGGCGKCHDAIQAIIDSETGKKSPETSKRPALTNIQKFKMIEAAFENEIKPALQKDGGNIELIDIDGNRVLVRLQGTCATCTKAQSTLTNYVEATLRDRVMPGLVVEEVKG